MIQILNLRPAYRPQDLAEFDVQLGPNLRIYNLALRRTATGHHRILAPKAYGAHVATFAPPLSTEITNFVLKELEGNQPNAESRN